MKQVISSWNKWVSGALMLSVLLLSTLFTGCQYDDTEITNRLDKLEEKVTKLENDLQTQVDELQKIAALQEAIEKIATLEQAVKDLQAAAGSTASKAELDALANQIAELATSLGASKEQIEETLAGLQAGITTNEEAISKLGLTIVGSEINEATGKLEVLLSNGTKIELLVESETAADVVTVKEFEGNKYWAIGDEFLTDADGNKIPVSITPQVKVNPDTKEVEVSVNGEKWHSTGIIIEEAEEVAPALISAISSDDKNLYIILADGTELTVALVSATPSVTISVMKLYVPYGETKTAKIQMTDVEKYIIVKPEGWRASIADGVLTVTAPKEGVGEDGGYVQIFTVNAEGKSAIYEVKVQAGEPQIAIEMKEGGLFDVIVSDELLAGLETYKWNGYLFGVTPLIGGMTVKDVYDQQVMYYNPWMAMNMTKSLTDMSVSEYVADMYEMEIENGVEYLVWAINLTEVNSAEYGGPVFLPEPFEDMYYAVYTKPYISIEVSNQTFKDADLNVQAFGMEGAYYMFANFAYETEDELNEMVETYKNSFPLQVEEYLNYGMTWTYSLQNNKFTGKLSELYLKYMDGYGNLRSGQTYMLMVMPSDNLTAEAVEYVLVDMPRPQLGTTTANVTVDDVKEEMTQVSAKITPDAGSEFQYMIMSAADYALCDTDEKKLEKLSTSTPYAISRSAIKYNTEPGEIYYLVIFVYDSNGVGKIITQELKALDLMYSDVTIDFEVLSTGLNNATIKVTTSGDVASFRYYAPTKADWELGWAPWKGTLEDTQKALALDEDYRIKDITTLSENGEYTLELEFMTDSYIFLMGVDKDGKPTKMADDEVTTTTAFILGWQDTPSVTPTVKDVLYTDDYDVNGQWYSMGTVIDQESLNELSGAFKLDIDWKGIEVKNVWILLTTESDFEETGDLYADTQEVIRQRSAGSPEIASQTSNYGTLRDYSWSTKEYSPKVLYVAYEDVDGNYYPYIKVTPESYCPPGSEIEKWQEGDKIVGWE